MKIKLAEALLRRKELQEKTKQLEKVSQEQWCKLVATRRSVSEGIDDIQASIPQVPIEKLTTAYDWHARRLRLIDAAIQQANWLTELDVDQTIMSDYKTE